MLALEFLSERFTVCQLDDLSQADLHVPFTFLGVTDGEISLVCPEKYVPGGVKIREDGFAAFRVAGSMELDLIGILARLSAILAAEKIGIFAVSTFDTDYILIRENNVRAAKNALGAEGYVIRELA